MMTGSNFLSVEIVNLDENRMIFAKPLDNK
jgi:hypothetical protein